MKYIEYMGHINKIYDDIVKISKIHVLFYMKLNFHVRHKFAQYIFSYIYMYICLSIQKLGQKWNRNNVYFIYVGYM